MGQSQPSPSQTTSSRKRDYLTTPPTLTELYSLFASPSPPPSPPPSQASPKLPHTLLTFTPHPRTQPALPAPPPPRKTRTSASTSPPPPPPQQQQEVYLPAAQPLSVEIHTYATLGERRLRSDVFRILERVMRGMYETSSMGWDPRKKQEEMRIPGMRFLVALPSTTSTSTTSSTSPSSLPEPVPPPPTTAASKKPKPLGYLAFEVVEEPQEYYEHSSDENITVMYCWELHIHPHSQRTGLGRHLMTILHCLARELGLPEVRLTVFRENLGARKLYKSLGYIEHYNDPAVDYLILRRPV